MFHETCILLHLMHILTMVLVAWICTTMIRVPSLRNLSRRFSWYHYYSYSMQYCITNSFFFHKCFGYKKLFSLFHVASFNLKLCPDVRVGFLFWFSLMNSMKINIFFFFLYFSILMQVLPFCCFAVLCSSELVL